MYYDPALLVKKLIDKLELKIPIGIHRKDLHKYDTYILIYTAGGKNQYVVDKYLISIEIYGEEASKIWDAIQKIRELCKSTKNKIINNIHIIQINEFGLPCSNPDSINKKISFIYTIQILLRDLGDQ